MNRHSRRTFLTWVGGTAVAVGYGLGKPKRVSANDKLNIAGIGVGGMGGADVGGCSDENIVALCDVDDKQAAGTFEKYPNVPKYRDFRVMLEKEKSIDAVTVSTPDHVHAIAAITAMQLGKHVHVQKPMAHTVHEARAMREAAAKYKVVTQMGNQGHAAVGVRRICEWVWAGMLGPIKEVHCWTDRPIWPQGIGRPADTPPVPPTLDWNLWLGPAPDRPYHPAYLPGAWRGWWDFGCGALGDMACHIVDPANAALKLGAPAAISAEFAPDGNSETFPSWCVITYEFPARGEMPPCKLVWYERGQKPPRPSVIPENVKIGDGDNASMIVGEKGVITCGGWGDGIQVYPKDLFDECKKCPRTIQNSPGSYKEWIKACKGEEAAYHPDYTRSRFEYAGPFTEMVLLGNVAVRVGKRIEYDKQTGMITNVPEANELLTRTYRKGWEV